MIKVGLIDDNYFLLNDYKEFLEDFTDISAVFTFTSLEELNKNIRHGIFVDEPDVVLLDIAIPGQAGIEQLYVSVYTVNHHLKNIYHKLGVASKSQLISRILQKTLY